MKENFGSVKEIKENISILSKEDCGSFSSWKHQNSKVLQLGTRVCDWRFKIQLEFTKDEIHALYEFSQEHYRELPAGLVLDIKSTWEFTKRDW